MKKVTESTNWLPILALVVIIFTLISLNDVGLNIFYKLLGNDAYIVIFHYEVRPKIFDRDVDILYYVDLRKDRIPIEVIMKREFLEEYQYSNALNFSITYDISVITNDKIVFEKSYHFEDDKARDIILYFNSTEIIDGQSIFSAQVRYELILDNEPVIAEFSIQEVLTVER